MTAAEFARRLGREITIRYFTVAPDDRHWRAALSKHGCTGGGVTVTFADSDAQVTVDGWGHSPDEACEELAKAMLNDWASRRRGALSAADEFGRRGAELEKLLTE